MRYFLDTEFDPIPGEAPKLISLGIVREDGEEFYAENLDYDATQATPWVAEHVVPHLGGQAYSEKKLLTEFFKFFESDPTPKFYCWVGTYDWFILWDLMSKYKKWSPTLGRDFREIKQLYEMFTPDMNIDCLSGGGAVHNALNDARWNMAVFDEIHFRLKEAGMGAFAI